MKIGVYYGSTTGNTESVANDIAKELKNEDIVVKSIADTDTAELMEKDMLILGSSTWGYGDLQDDWISGISLLKDADLSGKRVAFFGVGDQSDWGDTFLDAMGLIYEEIASSGATFVGAWPTEGYEFAESKAVIDGKFIGLAIDETNQSEETPERISTWVSSLN